MKKKQLIIAIQAAFLSMAMGNVSAAPLTAEQINQLDKNSIVNVNVGDITTDLTNSFIGKVVSLSVELNTLPPQLAQFLIDHNESADPKLTAAQIATLQQVVDTAVEQAIGILTETNLDTVTINSDQLVIGDLKISSKELQKFVVKITTFADFSKMNPPVAQFLLDHQADFPSLAEKITALKALLPATTTLTPADAISKLTDWSTVKLDADQNLMIGDVKIPADLISKFIEKVNSLTATELKSISPEVAKFILAKDDPNSPKLTTAQVTTLKALLPATTTLTPAEAISKLTDWGTVKLDAEQNLMIGDVKIPTDLISKLIEKAAALTETELKLISPEVAKFILAKDDPNSPKLTTAQVTTLKALLPATTTLTPAEAISKLTDWSTVKLDAGQLMIGEVKIPAESLSKFIEKVAALTETEMKSISSEVAQFVLAKDDPNSPKLTPAQVEILKGIKPPVGDLDISSLDAQAVSKLSLEVIASLTPEQVAQFQPAALKGLTKEQAVKLTVAAISGLTKEMVGSLSLEVVAALSDEQLAALSDEAKAGMTSAQVSVLGDKAKEIFDEKQLVALFTTEKGQVTVCHVPSGNPGKANSLDISPADVEKHLSHGDSLGPCATAGGKTVAEEEVNVIEVDLSHLTAQQLSELPLETIAQLTAKQIALIPTDAMIGMTKEQVGALTEKCVSGLSSEQVLALSSESLAGFNASNIGGLNQEILLAIGFDLLKLMPAEELKLLSASTPDVIVLVAINVLETTLPPQSTNDDEDDNDNEGDDEGNNDNDKDSSQLPSGLNELLTTIGWKLQSNQLVLSPESISALSTDFLASLSAQQFEYLHPTIMAQLTTEQMSSIKEETLAQLGDDYLDQVPEEKLSEFSPEFLTKFVLQLDVKKIEKKFKKKHAKDYAKYLEKFYEKLFKPLGWKVEVKEKDGQFFIKIKPKKEAFKFVSKQFVSLIDFEPSENETQADLAEKLTSMPTTSLEGLDDDQVASIPAQEVDKLPPAAAKPVQDKKTVVQFAEQASTGNVTEDTAKKLTPEIIGKIQPEQVAKFSPVTFKLFTAMQIGSLPIVSISVMTAPMVAQITPEAVSGLKADQLSAIPPTAVAGFNAGMIANLQVTAVIGFKHPQLAFLPVEAMEGWKPETFAALDPEEVDGFNVYQLIQMLHKKPEIRKAITEDQWENLPITPDTPVLPVVEDQTATDETSGDQTATDETSGDQTATDETSGDETATDETSGNETATDETSGDETATDETSGDETATDETSGDETATDETSGDETATDETSGDQTATDETSGDQTTTDETSGETTPIEVTVDEKTGQITLPQAEIDLSEADGITPTDLEIGTVDLTTPLIIDGEELPPIVEQLEETLTDVGMPDLTVTQEDGIVNITGSGDLAGTDLAFVPDEETIVRVEEGTPAGVTQDKNGFYIIVTPNGIQMTFLPAPKNPVQLLKLAHGNQGKGKLKKKKHGAFHFPVVGYGNVAAMFNPTIMPAPKEMKPGIFIEGMSGTVVYPNGTMQMIRPAMPEMAQLQVATMTLLGLEIAFEYQANGTAKFEFNGQNFKAIPTFEVAEDKPSDTSQPVLEVTNAKEGEQIETLNEQGEPVSEELIAKATIATEEGTQELNVVKDVTTTEAGNGETTTDESVVPETENTTDTSNTSPETTSSDATNTTNSDAANTGESVVPATENTTDTSNTSPATTSSDATNTTNSDAANTGESVVPAAENTTDTSNTSPATTSSDATNTTNSDAANSSDTTKSSTGEVTNENTASTPDTTPSAASATEPTDNSENSTTTTVSE
ncbi:hypothetical protein THII_3874 [Thioploca ingrica]|uniref:Uncharacterized protein n=1 Tax=Thioploca ingrica TaxID=40754 RepID=A0A090BW86_9GAMM|nr:hypothetical protein THII_3874 [Thioploca ingrica]